MINNRQNGRRRGRGGGPRSPNNAPSPGNRQENRSRGNASQLHEKYKALARDSQLAGDRVQTEYYLQFADHYFRVLNETRARFDEQRPRRDDFASDEDEGDEEAMQGADEGGEDEQPRYEREPRYDREAGGQRDGGRDRDGGRAPREPREQREPREVVTAVNGDGRPRRQPRPRHQDREDDRQAEREEGGERIALDVLPPAISAPTIAAVSDEGEPRPIRRRTRRPRSDGDTEIAPAA